MEPIVRVKIWQSKVLVFPFLAALAFVTNPLFAAESTFYDCSRSGATRSVELRVEGSSGVPCSVIYHRIEEGVPSRLLWKAQNDSDYCSVKLNGFLAKLENKLKWSCDARAPVPAVASAVKTPVVKAPVVKTPVVKTPVVKAPIAIGSIEPDDSGKVIIGLAEEPKLASALPQKPGANIRISNPAVKNASPNDGALTIELLRRFFPAGFYTAENQLQAARVFDGCPGSGYFVWNTRDRNRPVFEMGRSFEFHFSLETGTVVQQPRGLQTDQRGPCSISLTNRHCGINRGDQLNAPNSQDAANFSCEMLGLNEFNSDEAGLVLLAQRSSYNTEECSSENPPAFSALSAWTVNVNESSYLSSSKIQLSIQPAIGGSTISGNEPGKLTCSYIHGMPTSKVSE